MATESLKASVKTYYGEGYKAGAAAKKKKASAAPFLVGAGVLGALAFVLSKAEKKASAEQQRQPDTSQADAAQNLETPPPPTPTPEPFQPTVPTPAQTPDPGTDDDAAARIREQLRLEQEQAKPKPKPKPKAPTSAEQAKLDAMNANIAKLQAQADQLTKELGQGAVKINNGTATADEKAAFATRQQALGAIQGRLTQAEAERSNFILDLSNPNPTAAPSVDSFIKRRP